MNILSLFDGMSCGRLALDRAGIHVENYYASEVDKHAIKVAQDNWPENIQLGDVTKWREWGLDWSSIDLLIGGSPCQGFSFAGKQLAFDDPRSALFFEYLNILNHIKNHNPDVKFLLENVKMKKQYLDVISSMLKVEPVFINSSLVSAQSRKRYYWANWDFSEPEDMGITLSDVVGIDSANLLIPRGNNPGGIRNKGGKIGTLTSNCWQHNNFLVYQKDKHHPRPSIEKSTTLTGGANSAGNHSQMDVLVFDGAEIPRLSSGRIDIHNCKNVRRYSVTECERLQTVPDGYTQGKGVSASQSYKMLGNGWTVDVIAHIFRSM